MKKCARCDKEPKDYSYEKCENCGSSDFYYCTKDGTVKSNNPVYDG